MRANRHIVVIAGAGILLLVLGFVAWKNGQSRQQAERTLASVLSQRSALEAEWRTTAERVASQERARAEHARLREAQQRAKAREAELAAKQPARPRTQSEMISKNPKAEMLMLRWQGEAAIAEYGSFLRSHGITAEQVRRFKENWVRHSEQDIDLSAVARMENGLGEKELSALQNQAKAAYEAAEAEILGADVYRELKEYERTTVVARNVLVLGFAGSAALEGIPLTAQQGQQLAQAAVGAADPTSANDSSGEKLLTTIDWNALDLRARQILTPAQYVLYKTSAASIGFRSRWHYQLSEMVRQAQEADAAATR